MLDDKIDWMLAELRADHYNGIMRQDVEDILAGSPPEFFDDGLIDYVEELQREWDLVSQNP